jgi:hypothetical protein
VARIRDFSRKILITGKLNELPPEWIEQLQELNPRVFVPSSCQFQFESWSWYNQWFFPISYREFQKQVEVALPQATQVRLNPGVSVWLDRHALRPAPPLPWIQPEGEQDLDYEFNPALNPPPMAEIAKHFAALSSEQTERVLRYCQTEILDRFRSLEVSEDVYFRKPRVWRLALNDHRGTVTELTYRLQGSQIERLAAPEGELAWLTEVPMARLHGALEDGESLTSIYVRINDRVFATGIEKELKHVDPLEDPLLRCLFNGFFGSYQLAQLKRLRTLR